MTMEPSFFQKPLSGIEGHTEVQNGRLNSIRGRFCDPPGFDGEPRWPAVCWYYWFKRKAVKTSLKRNAVKTSSDVKAGRGGRV